MLTVATWAAEQAGMSELTIVAQIKGSCGSALRMSCGLGRSSDRLGWAGLEGVEATGTCGPGVVVVPDTRKSIPHSAFTWMAAACGTTFNRCWQFPHRTMIASPMPTSADPKVSNVDNLSQAPRSCLAAKTAIKPTGSRIDQSAT